MERTPTWWRWLALAAVLLGVALRAWQYLCAPSLWVDEAAVARNILDRGYLELLGPLDYGQVAPPGFLIFIKLGTAVFGDSEFTLRWFPILAGILSVGLFLRVARAVVGLPASIVATLLFSTATSLVYYSSLWPQYSSAWRCERGSTCAHRRCGWTRRRLRATSSIAGTSSFSGLWTTGRSRRRVF